MICWYRGAHHLCCSKKKWSKTTFSHFHFSLAIQTTSSSVDQPLSSTVLFFSLLVKEESFYFQCFNHHRCCWLALSLALTFFLFSGHCVIASDNRTKALTSTKNRLATAADAAIDLVSKVIFRFLLSSIDWLSVCGLNWRLISVFCCCDSTVFSFSCLFVCFWMLCCRRQLLKVVLNLFGYFVLF